MMYIFQKLISNRMRIGEVLTASLCFGIGVLLLIRDQDLTSFILLSMSSLFLIIVFELAFKLRKLCKIIEDRFTILDKNLLETQLLVHDRYRKILKTNSPTDISESDKFVLITSLFNETQTDRIEEYKQCLKNNLEHRMIKKIVVFYDTSKDSVKNQIKEFIESEPRIEIVYIKDRPTFRELFEFSNNKFPKQRIIIANGDIYFNQTLEVLVKYDLKDKLLALTRWNVLPNGTLQIFHQGINMGTSQDVWAYQTPIDTHFSCDFKIGTWHCDSFLSHHAMKAGIKVLNPCLEIQACHLHLNDTRSEYNLNLIKNYSSFIQKERKNGNEIGKVLWSFLEN